MKTASFILLFFFSIIQSFAQDYEHFIMYGQSLSTGHESGITLSAQNIPGTYMIGSQIWINYGNANLNELNPLSGRIALKAPDIIECPLLGAANHIRLKEKKKYNIIATSCGTSGKSIEDLSKESQVSNLYRDFSLTLESASKIAKQENKSIHCPAIFWLQGEWNYQGHGSGLSPDSKPTADKDEYKKQMLILKENMQSDIKKMYGQPDSPVFYTYQVGAQYTKGKEMAIGMAQLEASNEYKDIICAGPVYPCSDVGGHLDANGYRWYGEMLAKVYYKTTILKKDFKPLQPLKITRNKKNPNQIMIQFLVPKMPLVLDEHTLKKEKDYGFEIYNQNIKQELTDIKIKKDCVILSCSRELLGTIEVIYGGSNTKGHGNLRDSDKYKAFFSYEDLNKKDDNGNYIYPRKDNKILVSKDEPRDKKGTVIYGKKYPLYNFSVAFYYVIPEGVSEYIIPNLK